MMNLPVLGWNKLHFMMTLKSLDLIPAEGVFSVELQWWNYLKCGSRNEVASVSQVIVMGAEQNGLPEDYQEKLRSIETNKYEGPLPVMEELEKALKKPKKERTEEIQSDD